MSIRVVPKKIWGCGDSMKRKVWPLRPGSMARMAPVRTEWQLEFVGIDGLGHMPPENAPITTFEYLFARPSAGELTAVWRAFMPEIRGPVYLNGVYLEHHEPDRAQHWT